MIMINSHAELNFLQVKRREDNIMTTASATMKKRSGCPLQHLVGIIEAIFSLPSYVLLGLISR
jgi:hypothetical protein